MRLSELRTWALLIALVFLGSIAASGVNEVAEPSGVAEEPRPNAGTSERIVLVEEFTAQWCPPCVYAARALSRVDDEYSKTYAVVIAYHSSSDPFYNTNVIGPRLSLYVESTYYLPSLIVDGGGPGNTNVLWSIGASTPEASYDAYTADIEARRLVDTNLQITSDGDLTPTSAYASATVFASDDVTETNLYITFVLYEDNLYYMGTNGNPLHRVVARALYEEPISISRGDTLKVSHSFALSPGWDKNKLGFVVFVQSHTRSAGWLYNTYTFYNAQVLQAAKWRYVAPNTLYVRSDGVTDYKEYMETPLTYNKMAFENWNILDPTDTGTKDLRGSPSATEMEEYGATLWVAGSNGAINSTNMIDIADYLNAEGSVFVSGEDVATDITALNPTWLSTNLHATHGTDPVAATFVNGVPGDPITDPFNSTDMLFAGTSPDAVDPANGGIMILNYTGPISAAVRADHAAGSRVVFLGMNYFEGPDIDPNKRLLIENVLLWLDGAGGPKVSVVSPNGGEELSSGDIAVIKWKAVDVEVPVDAVDLYYTTSLSSPTWDLIATGEPNDGAYRWIVPGVTTTDCGVRVVVRDADPSTPGGEAISAGPCTIGAPNIGISKSVSNPAPLVYERITYTITVTNTGLTRGYVVVEAHLPSIVTHVSDDGNLTGRSRYYQSNATIAWLVQVPSMSSASLNIDVSVNLGPPRIDMFNHVFFNSTSVGGGSPQSGTDSTAFQIPSLETWSIDLTVGRHLISIPVLMLDYKVESVLATIAGSYDYVRTYTGDSVSPWISYEPGRPRNSLLSLPHGSAFWINIVLPCRLTVEGARPLGTVLTLHPGWNMIGYPSYSTTYTIGDMKTAIGQAGIKAEGFYVDSAPYNLRVLTDSDLMKTGEGYWVYVSAAGTWMVPL